MTMNPNSQSGNSYWTGSSTVKSPQMLSLSNLSRNAYSQPHGSVSIPSNPGSSTMYGAEQAHYVSSNAGTGYATQSALYHVPTNSNPYSHEIQRPTPSSSLQHALQPHAPPAVSYSSTQSHSISDHRSSFSCAPLSSLSLSLLSMNGGVGHAPNASETVIPANDGGYSRRDLHAVTQAHAWVANSHSSKTQNRTQVQNQTQLYGHSHVNQNVSSLLPIQGATTMPPATTNAPIRSPLDRPSVSRNHHPDYNIDHIEPFRYSPSASPIDHERDYEHLPTPASIHSAHIIPSLRSASHSGSGSGSSGICSPAPGGSGAHSHTVETSDRVAYRHNQSSTNEYSRGYDHPHSYSHKQDCGTQGNSDLHNQSAELQADSVRQATIQGEGMGVEPRPCVKTEPDLEDPSFERSGVRVARNSLNEPFGEGGGARFVMEHPYPYTYTSARESQSDSYRGKSKSPFSPSILSSAFPFSPHESATSHTDRNTPHAHEASQIHTLTAPLRAVNASAPMRACMGVFRLDPFAQLNGVALRCGVITSSDSTSGPENAFLSGDFSSRSKRSKAKRKKLQAKAKAKRRKRSGSTSYSLPLNGRIGRADEIEDEYGEAEDDDEDDGDIDEETPTWDGLPAGPLTEEPVLIEFQLYFEGMEVIEDSAVSPVMMAFGDRGGDADDEKEEFSVYGRDELRQTCSRGVEEFDERGYAKERGRVEGVQRLHSVHDLKNEYMYDSEDGMYDVRPSQQTQNFRTGAGLFEEYLDLDIGLDLEMDGTTATTEHWASAEGSPASPVRVETGRLTPTYTTNVASGSSASTHSVSPSTPTAHRLSHISPSDYWHFTYPPGAASLSVQSAECKPSATPNSPTAPSNLNANPTPFTNIATPAAGPQATLQQLRTQAALRAVSSHATHQLHQNQGQTQTQTQTQGTVNFTPTPASVAAEMQTGLLVNGRAHQQHSQQLFQHASRGRGSSIANTSGLVSSSQEGRGQIMAGPGNSYSQPNVNPVASPSGYPYTVYAPVESAVLGAALSSNTGSLAGALGFGDSPSPPIIGQTNMREFGARSTGGVSPFAHGGSSAVQPLAVQRRWSDVLQRVHG